jgi:hypothetical protein
VSGECAALSAASRCCAHSIGKRCLARTAIFATHRKKSKFIELVQRVTNLDHETNLPRRLGNIIQLTGKGACGLIAFGEIFFLNVNCMRLKVLPNEEKLFDSSDLVIGGDGWVEK